MDTTSMADTGSASPGTIGDNRAGSMGGDPSPSSGDISNVSQRQVPIPRTAGSGYERPERARTSHACEPCRERKTKCDGERPSCRRCLHTGTGCHYGFGKGWKKRKTAEDLTATSKKLARYEELLTDIYAQVSLEVRNIIDQFREQDFGTDSGNDLGSIRSPSSTATFDAELAGKGPSVTRLPLPVPASLGTTQSVASFFSPSRRFPPPPMTNDSQSSLQANSSSSRSPVEDIATANPLRLPSITRHGYLMDGVLRPSGQLPLPAVDGSRKGSIPQEAAISKRDSVASDVSMDP